MCSLIQRRVSLGSVTWGAVAGVCALICSPLGQGVGAGWGWGGGCPAGTLIARGFPFPGCLVGGHTLLGGYVSLSRGA